MAPHPICACNSRADWVGHRDRCLRSCDERAPRRHGAPARSAGSPARRRATSTRARRSSRFEISNMHARAWGLTIRTTMRTASTWSLCAWSCGSIVAPSRPCAQRAGSGPPRPSTNFQHKHKLVLHFFSGSGGTSSRVERRGGRAAAARCHHHGARTFLAEPENFTGASSVSNGLSMCSRSPTRSEAARPCVVEPPPSRRLESGAPVSPA